MRRLLPLIATVAAIAGCGGDDDDEPGRSVNVRAGTTLDVVADEYSFDPETIVVTGRGALTIALENRGVLAHNLRVIDDGEDVGGTPTFTGGKTREGVIALEPGSYELVCTVGNHADLGMTGALTVR